MHTLSPEIFHRTEILPKGAAEIKRVYISCEMHTRVFFEICVGILIEFFAAEDEVAAEVFFTHHRIVGQFFT